MSYQVGFEAAFDGDVDILRGSYRNVVQRLDARLLLQHYGAQNVSEHRGRYGVELVHSCLIDRVVPHHTNGDATPSAHFNKETLQYHCWSYGGGDVFWLIFELEKSVKSGQQVLSSLLQGSNDGPNVATLLEDLDKLIHGDRDYLSIPFYHPNILRKWEKLHPYLYEDRAIDPEVLIRHGVGYDEDEVRLVFPHFWKNKLVGWQKRRVDFLKYPCTPLDHGGEPAKYKNSTNFPKHVTLYNLPEPPLADTVVVVESVMSVLSGETAKLSYPVVATFGSPTDEQVVHLRAFPHVILYFDSDRAGRLATLNTYRRLAKFSHVTVVDDFSNEYDLSDHHLYGDDLGGIIESAVPLYLLEREIRDGLSEIQPSRRSDGS